MGVLSQPGVLETLAPLLQEAKKRAVAIGDGEKDLGAIVSMEDYEIVRRAKAEEFLRASAEFGEEIRARAAEDGLTADDLMRMLDRKAG